jgi:predicted TIM-barrel fold metal-dependent hydrolase
MTVIDSDAHVIETERTWDFMLPSDAAYRPEIVKGEDGIDYWMIEGKNRGRARGPVSGKGTTGDSTRAIAVDDSKRLMEDIPGRIAHMDQLNIDVQVLYPTMYISRMCDKPETEVALSRGYNRWLADIWKQADGRLRWTCMLPIETMEESLAELRWSAERGAVGVTLRSLEGDRILVDPYYFPLYEEAERLNIPITVHIGSSNDNLNQIFVKDGVGGTFGRLRLMSVAACHMLMTNRLVDQFPKLRFAFIEASAQWVPYVIHDLRRRLEARGRELAENPLTAHNIWVTAQTDDDLPYVLKYAGEDSLIIGTDYGHQDQSSEIEALRLIREQGGVEPRVIDKILGANAIALYGL